MLKRNYIEFNFGKDLTEDQQIVVSNAIIKVYPEAGDGLIDWRDSRILWIWPNGFGPQWVESL